MNRNKVILLDILRFTILAHRSKVPDATEYAEHKNLNAMIVLKYKLVLVFCMFLFAWVPGVLAQSYVQITEDKAAIFIEPNSDSDTDLYAFEGEIYTLVGSGDEWANIEMFSGEIRFLKTDELRFIYQLPDDINEGLVNPGLCEDILSMPSMGNQEENERVYFDKQTLELFRKHNVSMMHNFIFVGCINDSLRGPINF